MPKPRKMLGKADAPYIVALMALIDTQNKTTLVNWAVDYTETNLLPIYELQFPQDNRPRLALEAARQWLAGAIKLPEAKKHILAAHTAAREAEEFPAAQAAARAAGQAAATIHVATHALGPAFYGSAAIAYHRLGLNQPSDAYEKITEEVCTAYLQALQKVAVANEPNPVKVKWYC